MRTGRFIFLSLVLFMSCDKEAEPIGPTADFTYTANYLIVSFTDASTAGDRMINTWDWDFGDGTKSVEQNPVHTYEESGTYLVSLTVIDKNNLDDISTPQEIVVTAEPIGPTADFTYTANYLIVSFADVSTVGDGEINSWNWDFGNDETSDQQNPTNMYNAPGTYTVRLTVTDENNLSSFKEDNVTLEDYTEEGPAASFSFSANFLEVTFTDISAQGNGDIIAWDWDFGDGNMSTERNPVHTYEEDGTYTVSLTVTDENDLFDTYTGAVVVSATATFVSLAPGNISINLDINLEPVGELILQIGNLNVPIYGISLRIAYDATYVSFTGTTEYENGYFFGSEAVTFVNDVSSVIHLATTLTSGSGVSGSGILYKLEFEGHSEGSHLVEILPEFLFFYDSTGSEITIPNLIIYSAIVNVDCVGEFDECGFCNGNGIAEGTCDCNGNVEDCAGECGGSAYVDECDICDDNSDNDCTQDCLGFWGGDAVEDMCGTCDNDLTNDCVQDDCGVWGGDGDCEINGIPVDWIRNYNITAGGDIALCVWQTNDNGFILSGAANYQGLLLKTDSQGVLEWSQIYEKGVDDVLKSVRQSSDGGFIATGYYTNPFPGMEDLWVIKTDESGNLQWEKSYGTNNKNNWGADIIEYSDGGYVVTGAKNDDGDNADAILRKYNSDGSLLWSETYSSSSYNEGISLMETSEGDLVLVGFSGTSHGAYKHFMVKADADGNEIWKKRFGNNTQQSLNAVCEAPDGNYVAAGYCNNYSNAYIVQRNASDGGMEWSDCYDNNGYEWINDIVSASDGGYYLLDKYFYLIKADNNGGIVWSVQLDYANQSIIELNDGSLILAGNESSIWLFPLDPSIID